MIVLGVNLESNYLGKPLRDGGACILADGQLLIATAEERPSRIKTKGGYKQSVPYCLEASGLRLKDIDLIVTSSCVDADRFDRHLWGFNDFNIEKIYYQRSHHYSHAYSTYFVSPFDEAIVIINDGGGNIITSNTINLERWWEFSREQTTYYLAKGDKLNLLGRDFDNPYDTGFGEAFRAFTYYLGWASYTETGKTMALSAYGDHQRFKGKSIFSIENGIIKSRIKNVPLNPIGMLQSFAKDSDLFIGDPRKPGEAILDIHRDLAFFLQDQFENTLIQKINYLVNITGIKKLCMSGGVALNCIANSKILQQTEITDIFIMPAAGDTGQCIGNALFGYHELLKNKKNIGTFTPFLGKKYTSTREEISALLGRDYQILDIEDSIKATANLLAEGKVVAWVNGRSEVGPRALGGRSLLGNANMPSVYHRMVEIKSREEFRPFAPSILEKFIDEYYYANSLDPFMLFTAKIKPEKRSSIPNVVHIDDTSRVQSVSEEDNPQYYELINKYWEITGIPLIVNTSLNRRGEPIAESHKDAIDIFKSTKIDALYLDGILIKKYR